MQAFDPSVSLKSSAAFNPSGLAGKSVIITGGASGLGEQFAHDFVKYGAFVTIGDVNEENGRKVVEALGGGKKAAFVKCDVMSWSDQLKLFKTALSSSPSKSINVVCANAGISGQDDVFLDKTDGDGEPLEPDLSIVNINTIGVMLTAKLALHYLAQESEGSEAGGKCLILTASLAGYLELPGSPQYTASKFAVRGLMRSLRLTAPMKEVRVNLIAPWYINTPIMSQEVADKIKSKGIEFATREDAGAAVLHLASDQSLSGRAVAIVTHDVDSRGYMDLGGLHVDDYDDQAGFLADVTRQVRGSGHRIGAK
ncbi:hypothetical protein LTR78_007999 [Recurvomyces mirabilis]|uniref:5'-hydroxyaverantin dehydrogenase n=1 Tax=Recurvomyces mirabilis TaxID=574656 RepID=A0AAE0WJ35_9PEZI|nr:hypothetical protein LTR78_007999 [Recurvomyces mirabilis]KAK5150727.1 hypothetical protein LTS14_009789 [Recurvomyces mirabilis]